MADGELTPTYVDVAHALRELRSSRNLTLARLSKAAGVSEGHVRALEQGQVRNPRFLTLARLADGLGVRLSEVIDLATRYAEARQRG